MQKNVVPILKCCRKSVLMIIKICFLHQKAENKSFFWHFFQLNLSIIKSAVGLQKKDPVMGGGKES